MGVYDLISLAMISTQAIQYFKENGYSFEEIERIKTWAREIEEGLWLSEAEVFWNIEKTIQSHLVANA